MKASVRLAVLSLVVLGALAAAFVQVESDSEAIFGQQGAAPGALDRSEALSIIIALEAAEPSVRLAAAGAVAELLETEPLVMDVSTGPAAPDPALQEWVWRHRLQIAPPDPSAITADEMARNLIKARDALLSAQGMVLGDRLLQDPTGSFATILDRLKAMPAGVSVRDGAWEAQDASATLLFVTLAARPFEAETMQHLADQITATTRNQGAVAYLIGPRIIAAEVSTHIARASTWTALIALCLLLIWLYWSLGSVRLLGLVMLPLALGLSSAVLVVQGVFGGVHVIALGFGGALCGLALDYPLHLIGRSGVARRDAARLVLIGAITTAIGFLAMIGSGVTALEQTGLFVACGLLVSALAARLILPASAKVRRPMIAAPALRRLPGLRSIEVGLIGLGFVVMFANNTAQPRTLFDPPQEILDRLDRVREMIELPSGRYSIALKGKDLADLLAQEATLRPILEETIRDGGLRDYTMLAQLINAARTPKDLPTLEAFTAMSTDALRRAGMRPEYADTQLASYREALAAPEITPQDLIGFAATGPFGALLEPVADGWRSRVRLTGLNDPDALRELLNGHGVSLDDALAPIRRGLDEVYRQVVAWLAIGALAAFASLAIGLADWRRAGAIALTSLAALGFTLGAVTLIGGAPGILQIAALTLVMGIGIDYGLFLRCGVQGAGHTSRASVTLCAISTLIAFAVMAFSPVKILHEIGLTVSIGVIAMLVLHLSHSPPGGTDGA